MYEFSKILKSIAEALMTVSYSFLLSAISMLSMEQLKFGVLILLIGMSATFVYYKIQKSMSLRFNFTFQDLLNDVSPVINLIPAGIYSSFLTTDLMNHMILLACICMGVILLFVLGKIN